MSLVIKNVRRVEFTQYNTIDNDTPLAGECTEIIITCYDGTILKAYTLTTEEIGIEEVE